MELEKLKLNQLKNFFLNKINLKVLSELKKILEISNIARN